MALKLKITDSKGISTEYHRIISVTQNYAGKCISVNLAGYANDKFREEEKTTNEDKIISNTAVILSFTNEEFGRTEIYERIKNEVPEFAGAVDL